MRMFSALGLGLLFGLGLIVGGMANPAKIVAFLDIGGRWDPSLLFVMAGALLVTLIGYRVTLKRAKPVFGDKFSLPAKTVIDRPLVVGAAIFGIGWGLAGLCPGPALVGLAQLTTSSLVMIVAMGAGMLAHDRILAAKP